jgi:transcriptional regulator with XRE-family HTH domain
MKLGEKIRYLREVEGSLRGLDRAMTQQELVRAIRSEMDTPVSQSYLSQIESGARPHLTNTTRLLLARFFKVHPGYLVDDPEGYHAELLSDLRTQEDKLDLWLISGAERFRRDPELRRALLSAANHDDTRRCLLLLAAVLETPQLADRLLEVLRPELIRRPSLTKVESEPAEAHSLRNPGRNHRPRAGRTHPGRTHPSKDRS